MKYLTGSLLTIYGIYVFAGASEALGASVLWVVYTGISLLTGDMKIKKWEVTVPNSENAEEEQLNGLS